VQWSSHDYPELAWTHLAPLQKKCFICLLCIGTNILTVNAMWCSYLLYVTTLLGKHTELQCTETQIYWGRNHKNKLTLLMQGPCFRLNSAASCLVLPYSHNKNKFWWLRWLIALPIRISSINPSPYSWSYENKGI
jgi:hypothetical protein